MAKQLHKLSPALKSSLRRSYENCFAGGQMRTYFFRPRYFGIPSRFNQFERNILDFEKNVFRLMEDFPAFRISKWHPQENVETKDGIRKMKFDVADFKPEEIKVVVSKKQVKLSAKSEQADEDGSKISREFCKEFILPENVIEDSVKSFMDIERGILTIEAKLKELKATDMVEIPIEM